MTKVDPSSTTSSQTVYLPHQPVIRDASATIRLRVVFNASSFTSNGTSLNSHLHAGPKLQSDLPTILSRWRQFRYVYSADIAKMYRQMWIDPRYRDFQRIVWTTEDGATVQELCTVTYGTASAPFLALRVLKQLLVDESDTFPLAAHILIDNTYVDDVLFGAQTQSLLKSARQELCALLARGGFVLRKWASNHTSLLFDIPSEDHGLVLSTIAKLFDPLGWASPVIVTAKIFIQTLWSLRVDWDEVLPSSTQSRWAAIYQALSHLNEVTISHWTGQTFDSQRCELHGFAEASTVAYAACVYLRLISSSGEVTVKLLAEKSRVAPLKPMSIPRLELSAALLPAQLITFLQSALKLDQHSCFCWTDSTVTLAWIHAHPAKWKTFVANRVAEMQTLLPSAEWRHVSTGDNPAGCASRGLLGSELPTFLLWWQGPPWLSQDAKEWPQPLLPSSHDSVPDIRNVTVHVVHTPKQWELSSQFSKWSTLLRVTAYQMTVIALKRSGSARSKLPSENNLVKMTSKYYQIDNEYDVKLSNQNDGKMTAI
ncbi:PREDICTED: uncharacterized protein LOC105557339 [Vollenhovia emeryi]|uniref:uncharacterized protein LOC105557339 n=1 Tax=Vollenhovia emeryi TaxID=411798 RepID=UPI0005F5355C|nr:PREDICTED: uncharacterized protein LOC105557339 [Vollenhovia emeryi]